MAENDINDLMSYRIEAYGKVIRGDDTTSEDQICLACDIETANRIVACWNAFVGVDIEKITKIKPLIS